MGGGVPAADEFGNKCPAVAVEGVQGHQLFLLLGRPLFLLYSALEVVVVALSALLPVAPLNPVTFLHYPRNLAPLLYLPNLEELLQNQVFLQ